MELYLFHSVLVPYLTGSSLCPPIINLFPSLFRRMDLFNSLLSEVMFQKGLDSMDVDELICSINTSSQRGVLQRPFTLLEVKAFLQELDSQNRIFVSWEEDNTGTVYSI